MSTRQCGDCTLCCRLLPMQRDSEFRHPNAIAAAMAVGLAKPGIPDFDKPAGERCPHQRHHKGCAVHGRHPFGCQIWNCRWLVEDDTAALRRPDRAGYVLDIMPDFVTIDPGDGSPRQNIEAVVIWIDGKCPDAWRNDDALKAYLIRRGTEGKIALLRANSSEVITLFPPNMCDDGQWHEIPRHQTTSVQHGPGDLVEGLAACRNVKLAISK
jgi:hypothetical protein